MDSLDWPLATLFILVAVSASAPRAALADQSSPAGAPTEPSVQVEPAAGQPPAPPPEPPATNISTAPTPEVPAPAQPVAPAQPIAPLATTELGNRIVATSPPREARFGEAGQFVLDGALSASLGHLGLSAGGSNSSVSFQPAFDYFAAPSFCVGASALLRYIDDAPTTSGSYNVAGTKDLTLGLTGAVGLNAWLGDRVSFWPRLSLGVWWTRESFVSSELVPANGAPFEIASPSETQTVVVVELFAPFLVHLTQHFFIGFGPDLYADLHNTFDGMSDKRTFIGAASTVGGWF